jgi:hypothetical protein
MSFMNINLSLRVFKESASKTSWLVNTMLKYFAIYQRKTLKVCYYSVIFIFYSHVKIPQQSNNLISDGLGFKVSFQVNNVEGVGEFKGVDVEAYSLCPGSSDVILQRLGGRSSLKCAGYSLSPAPDCERKKMCELQLSRTHLC